MPTFILVMTGGAIGAVLRYGANVMLPSTGATGWPWATLLVNIVGGFLMGVVVALGARSGLPEPWRLFLTVGLLGGFTTFSAFSLDMMVMLDGGRISAALLYALASVAGAVLALALGAWLVRSI